MRMLRHFVNPLIFCGRCSERPSAGSSTLRWLASTEYFYQLGFGTRCEVRKTLKRVGMMQKAIQDGIANELPCARRSSTSMGGMQHMQRLVIRISFQNLIQPEDIFHSWMEGISIDSKEFLPTKAACTGTKHFAGLKLLSTGFLVVNFGKAQVSILSLSISCNRDE